MQKNTHCNNYPEMMGTQEVCQYLGIGRTKVLEYARMAGFPRLPGRTIRVYRPSLDAWLAAQCNPEE